MSKVIKMDFSNIERVSLPHFTEKAYLDYSMYVILDRALPALADGLKPVQRRIVYAMSELGLNALQKYKKSARTVGDVIGKFHPHGDSACYEAMVLMAQPFSYRYPLVDGQGNWGSMDDPKSFAAMRYTESRLTKYADVLLSELGQGTVDWNPNFDATLEEPKLLPAQLPNVLLNGGMGIAVGMSTDIPPHNVKEVISALLLLLENPEATAAEIIKKVPGPDYPTEAEIITPRAELKKIYETGNGTLKARAVYTVEDNNIVVTALPYQVSGAKVLEQIAAQMRAKKLPLVTDLRDESDHENPTRLIIEPKSSRTDVEPLMTHLFATTDLERTYRVNLNMIGLDGKPKVFALRELLVEWLKFRRQTVLKRLQFRLDKVEARLHLLDGFLIAYLNIDEVIRIIREEEKPKDALMKRFHLSDLQAESILELKLRHLAKLEEMKIKTEQKELEKEKKHLKGLIGSPEKLSDLMKEELTALSAKYGDKRRSPIVAREEARALKQIDVIVAEPVTIVISEKGWIRAAKGHEVKPLELSYKSGDEYLMHILAKTNDTVVFFDSTGRTYNLSGFELPSARGFGEPLSSLLKPPSGANFVGMMVLQEDAKVVLISDHGYGFVAPMSEMISKNKAGKAMVKLADDAKLISPHLLSAANQSVAMATKDGRLLVIKANELPEMPRGKGVKLIGITKEKITEEALIAHAVLNKDSTLVLEAGSRQKALSTKEWQAYLAKRGQRGLKMPRGFQSVDRIVKG